MVTSTTTPTTRCSLLLTSPLMRENPDTAESKSPAAEGEAAAAAQPGIPLYIICFIHIICFNFLTG